MFEKFSNMYWNSNLPTIFAWCHEISYCFFWTASLRQNENGIAWVVSQCCAISLTVVIVGFCANHLTSGIPCFHLCEGVSPAPGHDPMSGGSSSPGGSLAPLLPSKNYLSPGRIDTPTTSPSPKPSPNHCLPSQPTSKQKRLWRSYSCHQVWKEVKFYINPCKLWDRG